MSDALVIIPTYNEKENIENIIRTTFSQEKEFDILVVDDNSPDGTSKIVETLQGEFSGKLYLEKRKGKNGLGTAYIHGFKWAIEKKYDYIIEMDADFSHNPKDLIRLYDAAKNCGGMSVGSRYVAGGKLENWPWDRILLSYGASWYVRMITWMPVKDPTAGFVCYSRQVLEKMDFDKIRFIGYAFQIEMKFATRTLGFKIAEVPITFTDRVEGDSKMHGGIIKEAILGVLNMKWKSFFDSYEKTN